MKLEDLTITELMTLKEMVEKHLDLITVELRKKVNESSK
jgi:hypothetical protein